MIDLNRKYDYKPRNKNTGKFYSNGRKSTWRRPSAIINLLRTLVPNNWDVVLLPIDEPLFISSREFIDHYSNALNEKLLIKKEREINRLKQEELKQQQEEIDLLKILKAKYPDT